MAGGRAEGSKLRGHVRASARSLALVYGATLIVVLAAALIAHAHGRPLSHITHDPLAVAKEPFYVGALSNFGVLLWWAAAVACLLAALVLRGERDVATPLAAAGLLSAVLALDDLYMVHDVILPDKLGVPEPATYGAYLALGIAFLWFARELLRREPWALVVLASLFFAASIGIDVGTEGEQEKRFAGVEDVLKLFGIVTWTAFWIPLAQRSLRRATSRS